MTTIQHVARVASVSANTVSKVRIGREDRMRSDTLARVMLKRPMRPHVEPSNDPRQLKFAPTGLIERESVASPQATRRAASSDRTPEKAPTRPIARIIRP